MSKKAKLLINNQEFDFPLVLGSENELSIDVKQLRALTGGVTTIDPGFKNTASCESKITYLDGEKGILRYRGYSIEDLANNASFLEVAYLLIYGNLPTEEQYIKFNDDIKNESIVDEDIKKILEAFPKSAHPMGILSSLTSALTAFNPTSNTIDYDRSKAELYETIVKVLGKRNKERLIPLSHNILKDLESFVKKYNLEEYLFTDTNDSSLYPKKVYRIVNKYISMVSSIKKKSPHVLRHSFATHMLNNGADINAVKELLGHANLSATQIYTHNSIEKLKSVHKQAHPKS